MKMSPVAPLEGGERDLLAVRADVRRFRHVDGLQLDPALDLLS